MKEECGRTLKNSNRGWIKRIVVFLKAADELKPRRSREEFTKSREGIGEVSGSREDLLL